MKTIIVYHQVQPGCDCPDGIMAAYLMSRHLQPYHPELVGEVHQNDSEYGESYQFPFNPEGANIYIVDFSYPEPVLRQLAAKANCVTVLDHHSSRLAMLQRLSDEGILKTYLDLEQCGATLAWNFGPRLPLPPLLEDVRRRDIGAEGYYWGECPESEAATAALAQRRSGLVGRAAFPVLERALQEERAVLVAEGLPLLTERDRAVKKAIALWDGKFIKVTDYSVPLLKLANPDFYPHYSTIGTQFAKERAQSPFVALWTENQPRQIGLRGIHADFNLGEIAARLGGGGHPLAAGYKLPRPLN